MMLNYILLLKCIVIIIIHNLSQLELKTMFGFICFFEWSLVQSKIQLSGLKHARSIEFARSRSIVLFNYKLQTGVDEYLPLFLRSNNTYQFSCNNNNYILITTFYYFIFIIVCFIIINYISISQHFVSYLCLTVLCKCIYKQNIV